MLIIGNDERAWRVRHPLRDGPAAVRLHGQHLPLADRRGRDARRCCASRVSRTSWRSTAPASATGTPAARPTRARPRPPRARGVTLAGAARRVAAADFDDYDLILAADRHNLQRPARRWCRRGPAREAAPAAGVRPGVRGRAGPRRPGSLLRRRRRLRARARPRRGRVPRAARRAARRRPAVIAEAAAARSAAARRRTPRRRRRHQRRVAGRARRRHAGVRQDARGRAARRVRDRGGRRCAGSARSRAGCPVPEVLAVRTPAATRRRSSRSRGSTRDGSTPAGRRSSGAASRACTPPGRRRSARRRRARPAAVCGSARSSCPPATGDGLAGVLRRAPARAAAARGGRPRRAPGRRRGRDRGGRSRGCPSWPARPSRRRACTATCGAATCSPAATAGRG